jgi:flagellar basal body-associated protein FliL
MKKILGKKKILIPLVVVLLGVGIGYKLFLAPKPVPVVKKVEGTLVPLADPFTINLAGGHYGRVSVSLLVDPTAVPVVAEGSTTGPTLEQNDLVRSIITDTLTGIDQSRLIDRSARHTLLAQLVKDLKKSTDEPVKEVLITDLAVQ